MEQFSTCHSECLKRGSIFQPQSRLGHREGAECTTPTVPTEPHLTHYSNLPMHSGVSYLQKMPERSGVPFGTSPPLTGDQSYTCSSKMSLNVNSRKAETLRTLALLLASYMNLSSDVMSLNIHVCL